MEQSELYRGRRPKKTPKPFSDLRALARARVKADPKLVLGAEMNAEARKLGFSSWGRLMANYRAAGLRQPARCEQLRSLATARVHAERTAALMNWLIAKDSVEVGSESDGMEAEDNEGAAA